MAPSARALDKVLKSDPALAEVLRAKLGRQNVWRYRRGDQMPKLEAAQLMHELTDGRVPMTGWSERRAA